MAAIIAQSFREASWTGGVQWGVAGLLFRSEETVFSAGGVDRMIGIVFSTDPRAGVVE
jgi:hypothetical protein